MFHKKRHQTDGCSGASIASPTPGWMRGHRSPAVDAMLRRQCLGSECERVVQEYLGTPEYASAMREVAPPISYLLLHALERFLRERAIEVEAAFNQQSFEEQTLGPPKTQLIKVAPDTAGEILHTGGLFLRGQDGRRAILRVESNSHSTTEITYLTAEDQPDLFFDEWQRYAAAHGYLRGQRFYASGEFIPAEPVIRLDDVCMPPETRERIDRIVVPFTKRSSAFRRRRLAFKRGILLDGPPGTGKTLVCRAISQEVEATFIWLTARHVQGDADVVAMVWRLARMLRPTVVLLEDIDLFAESREYSFRSSILGELMTQMDGAEENDGILTIATTNRLDVIEKALRNRPGRFDRVIHFGALDEADRRKLLSKHLACDRFEPDSLNTLIQRTHGFTGAQIVELAKTIVEMSGDEESDDSPPAEIAITRDIVDQAMEEVGEDRRSRPIGFGGECAN